MKKLLKGLMATALAATMLLPLVACNTTASLPEPQPGGNDNMFMENDFEQDKDLLPGRVKEVKIKLGGNAKYADGSTEKVWNTGDTLKLGEDIQYTGTLPEGKIVSGWFDENNNYYKGADFDVQRKDMTITPALDVPEDAYAPTNSGTEGGKLGTGTQRTDGTKGEAYLAEWRDGVVDGEIGGVYHFVAGTETDADPAGKILPGFCFTTQTPYKVVAENGYTMTYRVENLGDETVTIRIHQSNSAAGAPTATPVSSPIEIEPGEVETVSLEFDGWNNGNVLNAVELVTEASELNLGIIKNVSVFDPATKEYELTLLGGATLENGETSGMFQAGESVKLVYRQEGFILTGWQNADNPSETYPVDGFTMPKKDITLKPVTVKDEAYSLTVQGGTISGGEASGKYKPNDTITLELTGEAPEGKVLVGWYNVEDRTEIYSGTDNVSQITMPAKDLTVAPLFDVETYFDGDTKVGKIVPDGGVYKGKETGCYPVDIGIIGAVKNADGEYELGNIYHFKGGTADAPAEMAADSWFLTTAMNNWGSAGNVSARTVTTTIENFGDEDVTLRFALIKSSSNPNSQYGEATVTIKAGETATISFDVTYLHNSFMTNIMVKDHAVSEVYIGMFQYISNAVS